MVATKLVDGCAPGGNNGASYPISSIASSRGLSVRRLTSSISMPSTLPSASKSNTTPGRISSLEATVPAIRRIYIASAFGSYSIFME